MTIAIEIAITFLSMKIFFISENHSLSLNQVIRSFDQVAYVRFASVYREFRDVDTFLSELRVLRRGKGKDNAPS